MQLSLSSRWSPFSSPDAVDSSRPGGDTTGRLLSLLARYSQVGIVVHCTLHTTHWTLHAAHWTLHAGHWTLDTGYWTHCRLESEPGSIALLPECDLELLAEMDTQALPPTFPR